MRAFRIGYILTFSFLLVLMVVSMTFGFFPAPTGPKSPTYPTSSSYSDPSYSQNLTQYDKQQKQYQESQKTFLQEKIVPYARNVFVSWIILLITFQIVGMVAGYWGSGLVGAGFSFSGVWAVIFGPLGGLLWFANSLVASLGRTADNQFSLEPIYQAIGLTSLVGVIVMSVLGVFLYGRVRQLLIPTPPSHPDTPSLAPNAT